MEGSSSISSQLSEAVTSTEEATTDAGINTSHVADVLVTGRQKLVANLPNMDRNAVALSVSSTCKSSSHNNWPPENMCKTMENGAQQVHLTFT